MSGVYGEQLKISIFGESHGPAVGAVISGFPAGFLVDMDRVHLEMDRRRPGTGALATARQESDEPMIESGLYNGYTTGTPLCIVIPNQGQRSEDYPKAGGLLRPGHGDYTGFIKYRGFGDPRGGGHFSGRITASLVFAGALAAQWLEARGIFIGSHILRIGQAMDRPFDPLGEKKEQFQKLKKQAVPCLEAESRQAMEKEILKVRQEGNSIGGVIETMAIGLPAGIGDPFFDSVESRLSHALFSIPAVKGVEFGGGFALAEMKGSESNDAFRTDGKIVWTQTNRCGGVLGGITTGMPLLFRIACKPTPSIFLPQRTVDISSMTEQELRIKGRHDPCIVPRAAAVADAVTAWILMDMILTEKGE